MDFSVFLINYILSLKCTFNSIPIAVSPRRHFTYSFDPTQFWMLFEVGRNLIHKQYDSK